MPCTVKKTLELAAATDALMIAQVKDNQPTLLQRVEQVCAAHPPVDQHTTRDQNQHARDETRRVEVFDPRGVLADTEWSDYVGAIIRVSRTTHRRMAATGMWQTTSEIAYFVCAFLLPAALCAQAIRNHWAIENRLHYVRDMGFREDDSRIRCKPGIFARLRSFAANILRFNKVKNVSDARYRIAIGGHEALASLRLM
jgi:predicted transposase YbfD/YdcC